MVYEDVIRNLRTSYDGNAEARAQSEVQAWKVEERWRFLGWLQAERRLGILEIGAGPGLHGKFFQEQGLEVVCTDLSPEHVRLCKANGLTAYALDFLSLPTLGQQFSAVFGMNCLLHVPRGDLPRVLTAIRETLEPGGLFYWGQYGGKDEEGVSQDEPYYEPKRFFSLMTNDRIVGAAAEVFAVENFRCIGDMGRPLDYQALILRRPL